MLIFSQVCSSPLTERISNLIKTFPFGLSLFFHFHHFFPLFLLFCLPISLLEGQPVLDHFWFCHDCLAYCYIKFSKGFSSFSKMSNRQSVCYVTLISKTHLSGDLTGVLYSLNNCMFAQTRRTIEKPTDPIISLSKSQ